MVNYLKNLCIFNSIDCLVLLIVVNKNNFLILSILYIDILKYGCKVSVKRRQYKIKISFILRFI